MKKILFISVLIFVAQLANAQLRHGIKLDGAFSTITGTADYGTDIKSVFSPGISYSMLLMGDKWGFIYELGYSQAGFKEIYNDTEELSVKTHYMNCSTIGLQYAFLDDWAKIRPILQARLGLDICLSGKISNSTQNENFDDYNVFSLPVSISAGIMSGKHLALTAGYRKGLLNYFNSISGKNSALQISLTYYF